jgi:Uncharacterized protein conserved in bacteria (DUF2059)
VRHLALLSVWLIASPLGAQSAANQKAALELIALQNLKSMNRMADSAYVDWLLGQNPELAEYRAIVERHSHRVYDWPTVKLEHVRILTELFSEQELDELAAFWKSPIGRKWAATAGTRLRAGGEFLDRRFIEFGRLFHAELDDAARRRGHRRPVVRFMVPS